MAFFDQLSSKLSQTSQSAVQKTKDMAEVVRLNGQISERERRMEQIYREMGRRYYEQCAGRNEELFREQVAELQSIEAEIREMRTAVQRLKGSKPCPVCGAEQAAGALFCNACGAKMPQEETGVPAQATVGLTCAACGAVMPEGTAFCTNCGTKLAQKETGEP